MYPFRSKHKIETAVTLFPSSALRLLVQVIANLGHRHLGVGVTGASSVRAWELRAGQGARCSFSFLICLRVDSLSRVPDLVGPFCIRLQESIQRSPFTWCGRERAS